MFSMEGCGLPNSIMGADNSSLSNTGKRTGDEHSLMHLDKASLYKGTSNIFPHYISGKDRTRGMYERKQRVRMLLPCLSGGKSQ